MMGIEHIENRKGVCEYEQKWHCVWLDCVLKENHWRVMATAVNPTATIF